MHNEPESNRRMRYYGQFEPPVDRLLYERYFSERSRPGFFVECGAFDGETECSCKLFEESFRWTGINVEPSPPIFARLCQNRPHSKNVNAALGKAASILRFTAVIHPEFGEFCTNGSLQHAPQHASFIKAANWDTVTYDVQVLSWIDLIDQNGIENVDLLVLDVEGTELDVIEGMRRSNVLPQVFCVEHGHLGIDTVRDAIEPLGYRYDMSQHVNSYFVRHK